MPPLPAMIVLAIALSATAARADTVPDVVTPYVAQLSEQGYGRFTVGTTWLGRIVITASRDGIKREIILNPRTGALLSDSATLPPAAERLDMSPDDDDNSSAEFTGSGATTATTMGLAGEGSGGGLLDAGEAKDSAFGDGTKGSP